MGLEQAAIAKDVVEPRGRRESPPVPISDVADGLKVVLDLDEKLLADETVDVTAGAEYSLDDGVTWHLLFDVGYDGAVVARALKNNPDLPVPEMPWATYHATEVDTWKARGASVRAFVRVNPTKAEDEKEKAAVDVGVTLVNDATSERLPPTIQPTHHSVAYDTGNAGTTGTGTSTSFSFTTAGSDRCLYAAMNADGSGTVLPLVVTYNSVELTQLAEVSGTGQAVWLGRLVAPTTGANTLAYTFDFEQINFCVNAISFTGVDQAAPDGTPVTAQAATGTSTTSNVSSATGDIVLDAFSVNNGTVAGSTPGTGQTTNAVETSASSNSFLGLSYEAGATTVTMSWSWSTGSTRNAHISVNIKASAGGAATTARRLPLLGVG